MTTNTINPTGYNAISSNSTASNAGLSARQGSELTDLKNTMSDFKQMLTTMMMASQMSSFGMGDTGSMGGLESMGMGNSMGSSTSAMNPSMFMMPVMFTLMEKLMERQLEALMALESAGETTNVPEVSSGDDGLSPTGMPVEGVLTQDYHTGHIGLDFGIPEGTAVHTSMDGEVVYSGWNTQGYGNLVIVQNGRYKTYYAHLSQIPVQLGQWVSKGDTIGLSGNTGNSTGPHLHYEVRVDNQPINPTNWVWNP